MTPRQYLDEIARKDMAELEADYGDLRKAFHAVHSIDALAAHIFVALKTQGKAPSEHDSAFRKKLAGRSPEFALVRSVAKALKHVELTEKSPQVSKSDQVKVASLGWGVARYGEGRYGGPSQATVTTDAKEVRVLETVLRSAITFLEGEMSKYGL